MKKLVLLPGLLLAMAMPAVADHDDDHKMIENAESAAPAAVSKSATIMHMDEKGAPHVIREGSNGWTCMPDNPGTPGNDPMCLDKGGMAWAEAWIGRKKPDPSIMGFAYMLAGGSDASNTDPHATAPAPGSKWVDTGPHVMIFNAGKAMEAYPRQGENPDTSAPYVMWPGTDYEHLMIPVK